MVRDADLLKTVVEHVTGQVAFIQPSGPAMDTSVLHLGWDPLSIRRTGRPSDARAVNISGITSGYADALLVRAMANVGFAHTATGPLPADVVMEIGAGVEHTFTGPDGTKTVTIGRAESGRLHFAFGGYSKYDAQEVANLITDSMKAAGLDNTGVTIHADDERWLEERLPGRQRVTE
jgi:hypothetical protein